MDNKALLDELMGIDRDLPPEKRRPKLKFDDPEVCRFFLAAFCPHDLFRNTRDDLGSCPRTHDEKLREDYLKSDKIWQFEGDLLRYLEKLLHELERKIARSQERLNKEIPVNIKEHEERISEIASEIKVLVKEAEVAGDEGDVDKAKSIMDQVDLLNKEKIQLLGGSNSETVAFVLDKDKRMQVCQICGAMQAACDTEKKLASHYDGKLHIGYKKIRETVKELKKKREAEREAKQLKEEKEGGNDSKKEGFRDDVKADEERPRERRRERSRSRERSDRHRNSHYSDRRRDSYSKESHHGRRREYPSDRDRERNSGHHHRSRDR